MTKKYATVEQLAGHARELAAAFNIPLMEQNDMHVGQSVAAFGLLVVVPVIDDEQKYAAALHEMGHLAAPDGQVCTEDPRASAQSMRLCIHSEEAAWAWAEHYALDWTPTMEHLRGITLGTYYAFLRELEAREARAAAMPARVESVRAFADRLREREAVERFAREKGWL